MKMEYLECAAFLAMWGYGMLSNAEGHADPAFPSVKTRMGQTKEKKMNRMMLGLTAVCMGALVGCSTVDPLTVPQTARDKKTYTEKNAQQRPTERYKIAIISKAIPHESDKRFDSFLAGEMESAVANNFSNLGWFETVDRKNGVALAGEAMLAGGKDLSVENIPGAQLALVVESKVSYVAKQGWKRTSFADKARGAQIDSDFRLIDLATKEPLLVKKIRSVTTDCEKGNIQSAITMTANQSAKKFARVVAARYLPEVKVLQTRGNGRYAQVAMGKNYQATPAVKSWGWWPYKYFPLCYVKTTTTPAATIDFFTIDKDVAADGKATFDQSVFAHGMVISAENKRAWVEVSNYETAEVYKGHNARVSESTDDGFGELE